MFLRETCTSSGCCQKSFAPGHIVAVEFRDLGLQRTAQIRDVAVGLSVTLEVGKQVADHLQVVQLT